MTKTRILSLNTKITLAFISIGFILLFILFVQIIPRLISEQKAQKKHQLEHMIILTQNQLKFASELLVNERKESISKLEKWFYQQSSDAITLLKQDGNKQNILESLSSKTQCNSYIINKKNQTLFQGVEQELTLVKKRALGEEQIHFFHE